jgi:transcriptional regulator with XRE-family HTH domain
MTTKGGKPHKQNRLWIARKRRGLGQKQVAHLLDSTVDEVSRCERGAITPGLEIALGLEIVYGVPARILFAGVYEKLRAEITERINSQQSLKKSFAYDLSSEQLIGEFCVFEDLLNAPALSDPEASRVRDHITRLAKRLAYR